MGAGQHAEPFRCVGPSPVGEEQDAIVGWDREFRSGVEYTAVEPTQRAVGDRDDAFGAALARPDPHGAAPEDLAFGDVEFCDAGEAVAEGFIGGDVEGPAGNVFEDEVIEGDVEGFGDAAEHIYRRGHRRPPHQNPPPRHHRRRQLTRSQSTATGDPSAVRRLLDRCVGLAPLPPRREEERRRTCDKHHERHSKPTAGAPLDVASDENRRHPHWAEPELAPHELEVPRSIGAHGRHVNSSRPRDGSQQWFPAQPRSTPRCRHGASWTRTAAHQREAPSGT